MSVSRRDSAPELFPMAIAALVAVMSVAALLLLDFAPTVSQDNADRLTTASVLSRAGAIATPSEKPIDIEAPQTIRVSGPGR